ncbi:MAG: hypothetical protein KF780_03545 [Sphingomonas sp.]|nr:hypothetical protein [Sphingomonas sp.]
MRIIIIAAATLLTLAGCERGGNAPAAAANALAETDADEAAASPADPALLAALLPSYPGARQVRDGRGEGAVSGSLAFATPDPPRRVAEFYADAAHRAGFVVDIPETTGLLVTMAANNEDGGLVSLTATRVGDVTEVQIMAAAGGR